MNDTIQNRILEFVNEYGCCKAEHIKKLFNCSQKEIDLLLRQKHIKMDSRLDILRRRFNNNNKPIDIKYVVALDVLCTYIDKGIKISYYELGKLPVNIKFCANNVTCDIIIIRKLEQKRIFSDLYRISKSARSILVLEDSNYKLEDINTKQPCIICSYNPLKIIGSKNN